MSPATINGILRNNIRFIVFFLIVIIDAFINISCNGKIESNPKVEFKLTEMGFDYHYTTLSDFRKDTSGLMLPENIGMDLSVLNTHDTTVNLFLRTPQNESGLSMVLKMDTIKVPLVVYKQKLKLPPNKSVPLRTYVKFASYNDLFDIYFRNMHDTAYSNIFIQLGPVVNSDSSFYLFDVTGSFNERLYFEDTVIFGSLSHPWFVSSRNN